MGPATPTTRMAHARREWKASEQALILCPAPESIKNVTRSSGACVGGQGGNGHWGPAEPALVPASFACTLRDGEFVGRRSVGVLGGYSIKFVLALYVASP
jgi:hypothetical protein